VSNGFRDYRVARNSWQSITESVGEDDTHSPTNGHIGFPFPSGQNLKSFACQRNLGLRIWHSARLSVSEAIVTLNRYHVAPRLEDLTRRTGPSGIPPGKVPGPDGVKASVVTRTLFSSPSVFSEARPIA